jgi:hypothetical protein
MFDLQERWGRLWLYRILLELLWPIAVFAAAILLAILAIISLLEGQPRRRAAIFGAGSLVCLIAHLMWRRRERQLGQG